MHDNGDTHSRVMAEGKLQHPILQSRAHHARGNRDMLKDFAEIYRIAAR